MAPRLSALARRALCAALLAVAGCAAGGGHPPTARLTASPDFIPFEDGYTTPIVLDGSASRDEIDDPMNAAPLRFRYEIDDPAPRVTAGSLDAAAATVLLAGARPTAIRLVVTDGSGDTGTARFEIGVTIPPDMR